MKYIAHINELIGKKTATTEHLVLFGQNIAAGSHISGLTKNLKVGKGGMVINTANVENTLAGIGFGMILGGVSSIFFMKQQDFLLLGIDHLVNTYNFIRRKKPSASFTIVFVVVDSGYQGLQSSINNLGDFCSIARIPGFTITNIVDAQEIIETHLVSPGFRILAVSQRLFSQDVISVEKVYGNEEKTIFQYSDGSDATIVCFNFAFPYGLQLAEELRKNNVNPSLFSVNMPTPLEWDPIIDNVKKTKKVVIIDDSKSMNFSSDNLLSAIYAVIKPEKVVVLRRVFSSNDWLFPNSDELLIDYNQVAKELVSSSASKS